MLCVEKVMDVQHKIPLRNWHKKWWLKLREKQFTGWVEEGKCSLLVCHFILTHGSGSCLDQPGCSLRDGLALKNSCFGAWNKN